MRSMRSRLAAGALAVLAMTLLALMPTTAASAAPDAGAERLSRAEALQRLASATALSDEVGTQHLDGTCHVLDLCLFYGSGLQGSMADYYQPDYDLNNDVFLSAGDGQANVVGNNSRSALNADTYYYAIVCTGVNYSGTCGYIAPGTGGEFLPEFVLNVESFYWA